MTTYITKNFVKKMQPLLRNIPFWKGELTGRLGVLPLDDVYNSEKYIEFEKLWALTGHIEVSDDGDFGSSPEVDMSGLHRKLKWFNGILGIWENDMEDAQNGNKLINAGIQNSMRAISYQHDRTAETWVAGFGTTFTSRTDYDKEWIPCFKLSSAGTIQDPSDINSLVTTRGGSTGSSGAELDMGTALTSLTTKQTNNFVDQTFGPFTEAFEEFEDTRQGNRMTEGKIQNPTDVPYACITNRKTIRAFKNTKVFNGEYYTNKTVHQEMLDAGIECIPCNLFAANFAEDAGSSEGDCQFAIVPNIERNFKIGIGKRVIWEAWKEVIEPMSNKSKFIKKMKNRATTFSEPYLDDDDTWYKAAGFGTFYYMNDA